MVDFDSGIRERSGPARASGLTILVDHDRPNPKTGRRAGIEAARAVVSRYAEDGFDPDRDIQVIMPPTEGQDAADLEVEL